MNNNKYSGHTKPELKALLRVNKDNPEAQKQIKEAIEALKPPYKAGRLVPSEIQSIADVLAVSDEIVKMAESKGDKKLITAVDDLKLVVAKFKITTTAPGADAAAAAA